MRYTNAQSKQPLPRPTARPLEPNGPDAHPEPRTSLRTLRVGGVVFVAGEEVSVSVEGDGDACVAHVGAECFDVDAGGDHEGGVGVAAFVQGDWFQVCGLPCLSRSGENDSWVEGAPVAVREDVAFLAVPLAQAVGEEVLA